MPSKKQTSSDNSKRVQKADNKSKKSTADDELITGYEVLKDLPEDKREKIISVIREESTSFMGIMKQQHPFIDKITPEHITDLIKNSDIEDQRDRKERGKE